MFLHTSRTAKHPTGTIAILAVVCALLATGATAHARPPRKPFVELAGPGGVRTLSVAGRLVKDMAVADRVLVGIAPTRGAVTTASASAGELGGEVTGVLGGGRILVVDLPEGSDILAACQKLYGAPGIEFVEPDRAVYTTLIPDDPEYVNQYHHEKIFSAEGWDITTGSADIVVAIIDSGIDSDHPDFTGRLWTNPGEIPGNGIDDDLNGYIDDVRGWDFMGNDNNPESIPDGIDQDGRNGADDQVNHGSVTAGLVAAALNSVGTVGVAPMARIMPLKVFEDDGGTAVSTVVDAMFYAARNGADIMNLSIGSAYSQSFTPPITELWQRGGLSVSAGGNSSTELRDAQFTWSSPACNNGPNPLVDNQNLGVGGLTALDRVASWSNYDGSTAGNFIEVFAPGVNVYGPAVYFPSIPGFASYYTTKNGTSFACPLVAGLAALLMAQDPGRTGADVIQIIRDTADNIDNLNSSIYQGKLGTGRINVARALGADLSVAPPTDVMAYDTPADQGGSITVTWTRSTDDGGGQNSVTEYRVERSAGALPAEAGTAQASWALAGTVAAGGTTFIDSPTTDGIAYFYRVAAVDPSDTSFADPVGPVYSVDDSAPGRIETLTAYDRPFDNGGAVDLDWSGYQAPGDLVEFRIYRSGAPITSVLGATPISTVADPGARAYADETTADGVDYYYAVTGVDNLGNERQDVVDAGPVQSLVNGPVSFLAGLHMLGPLAVPADRHPATLFGLAAAALRYGVYNTPLGVYDVYQGDPLAPALELALGKGFFINFTNPITFTPSGSTAPAGNFTLDIQPGWQQIANPFFEPLDFSASAVTFNNNTMDLVSADTLGVMYSYAWVYNHAFQDYELLHPQLGSTTLAQPWAGMWVFAQQACSLTLVRGGGQSAQVARSDKAADDGWAMQLIARGDQSVDAANYCGVSGAQSDVLAPPPAKAGVELYFISPDAGSDDARYATAFTASQRREMSWDCRVAWSVPQSAVTISWPDLSAVPNNLSLTLHDQAAGRRVSMRHQTSYTITGTDAPGSRTLKVEASEATNGGLQISSMSARSTSIGAEVVFTLSTTAACDVAVMNIAGRPVSVVESGRVRTSGSNVVVWNGRSSTGVKVPRGRYLVRVTARAEDGSSTSALRTLQVQR